MFDFLKSKKLVGRVPARFRVEDKGVFVFEYRLYQKGKKRTYEVVITKNPTLARVAYIKYATNKRLSLQETVARAHSKWDRVITPWLEGKELSKIYTVDEFGDTVASKLYQLAIPRWD